MCFRGHSCGASRFWVSRFMPCCVEWVRFVVAYLFHGSARGRQSVFRITGRPTACTWTMSDPLRLCGSCEGFVSCFLWDRPTLRERISGFWWVLFPVPFTVWLPVGNTVTGKGNQSVGRSPVVWSMWVWEDSTRGVLSDQDHSSHSRREVTVITFAPLSLMWVDEAWCFHPPGWMMDSSESLTAEVTCAERVMLGCF